MEFRCIACTIGMLFRGELASPRRQVDWRLTFADGTTSRIYRETTVRRRSARLPVLIVVRFKLRLVGHSRVGHLLFRVESWLNTVLFAAHRGFQTKLWLTDPTTSYYRGIYEWDGADAAVAYAETLRVVLEPWVQAGTFAYRLVPGEGRDSFLSGSSGIAPEGDGWWLPVGIEEPSSIG